MTTAHRLTGSRVALAERCLHWARPDVALPARASSAPADLGSATHEAIEVAGMGEGVSGSATDGDDDETIADAFRAVAGRDLESAARLDDAATRWKLTPGARAQLEALYETWAEWWPSFRGDDVYTHEVPMAWDTARWSARVLPSRHQRDYSAIVASEIPLTIDALHVENMPDNRRLPRTGTVIDWKTGRTKQAPAAEHAQLATAALCAAHVYGLDRVRVAIVRILPGYVHVDTAEFDTMALDARALSLEAMIRAIPTAGPVPGPWCASEYCPALAVCQGPRALATRAPELARALPVTVTTEAEAAAVLGAMKPLQAYLDGIKRSAIEWAERHGGRVRMPDGSTMVRAATVRRSLDVDRCLPVLRSHLGDGADGVVTVKRSISVDKVETAIKALHPRGKKKAAIASAMADLETSGGVRVTSYDTWETERAPVAEEDKDI